MWRIHHELENEQLERQKMFNRQRRSFKLILIFQLVSSATTWMFLSAHSILRENLNLFPYKAQEVQDLTFQDYARRHAFALRMMRQRVEDPNFERNLFFIDEANFHTNGVPNRQNYRTWASHNPHEIIEEPLHSDKTMAIIGVGFYGIVGPFFFDGNVNGESYFDMLIDKIFPALIAWPNFEELVLVQDGAPAHWSVRVRNLLDVVFPNRWIGRDSGFICWPPRSPDLTPMDFYVWSDIKRVVYDGTAYPNLRVLMDKIREVSSNIPLETVRRSLQNFWRRILLCEQTTGMHIEDSL